MVKRHKTGRRQILCLEDKKPPPQVSSSKAPPPRILTQYSDSEDDEDKKLYETEVSVSSATETVAVPIDSQVADFLKEIDALADDKTEANGSEAEPKQYAPGSSNPTLLNSNATGPNELAKANAAVYCVWQHCQDESTGYSYFWNIQTNEVTWECPPEYLAYLKYMNSSNVSAAQSSQPSTSSTQAKPVKKPKKHEPVLKEGAIIPISYYGGSSSSDSSDDDDSDDNRDSRSSKKNLKTKPNKNTKASEKVKTKKEKAAPAIGPQLPPHFQFVEKVATVEAELVAPKIPFIEDEDSLKIGPLPQDNMPDVEDNCVPSDEVPVEIGSQLPQIGLQPLQIEQQLFEIGPQLGPEPLQIGPQLPQDYTQDTEATFLDDTVNCEIGTKFPSNYLPSAIGASHFYEAETEVNIDSPQCNEGQRPDSVQSSSNNTAVNSSCEVECNAPSVVEGLIELPSSSWPPPDVPVEEVPDSTTKKDEAELNIESVSQKDEAKLNIESVSQKDEAELNIESISQKDEAELNVESVSQKDEADEVGTVVAFRPVVEYDSFTDTEEEMDVSSNSALVVQKSSEADIIEKHEDLQSCTVQETSPEAPSTSVLEEKEIFSDLSLNKDNDDTNTSKEQCTKDVVAEFFEEYHPMETNISSANVLEPKPVSSNSVKSSQNDEPYNLAMETNISSANVLELESVSSNSEKSSQKPYNDIIGNMFSYASETIGKFGFGFSKEKQLELENEACNMSGSDNFTWKRSRKGRGAVISFVKSENVLDLNSLNKVLTCSEPKVEDNITSTEMSSDELRIQAKPEDKPLEFDKRTAEKILTQDVNVEISREPHTENLDGLVDENKKSSVTESIDTGKVDDEDAKPVEDTLAGEEGKSAVKPKKKSKKKKKIKEELSPVLGEGSAVENDMDEIDKILSNILKEKEEADRLKANQAKVSEISMATIEEPVVKKDLVKGPVKKNKKESKKHGKSKLVKVENDSSGNFINESAARKHSLDDSDVSLATVSKKIKKEEPEEPTTGVKDLLASIIDLSTLVMDKVSFLCANHSTMAASLGSLLVQIQTRVLDWQAGALNSEYLMDRLEDVNQYLQNYEAEAVSGSWTCQWDRENKRYFYVNQQSQLSQWEFPTEPALSSSEPVWDVSTSSLPAYGSSEAQFPLVSSSNAEDKTRKAISNGSVAISAMKDTCEPGTMKQYPTTSSRFMSTVQPAASPPPPPPGVDSPPPPPPAKSPPPPPPDSTEIEEGEIPDVDMDLEDSNSSDGVSFYGSTTTAKEGTSMSELTVHQAYFACSSFGMRDRHNKLQSTNAVSSSTSVITSEPAVIIKSPKSTSVTTSFVGNIPTTCTVSAAPTWTAASYYPSCSSSNGTYQPLLPDNKEKSVQASVSESVNNEALATESGNMSPVIDNSTPSSSSSAAAVTASVVSQKSTNVLVTTKKEKKKTKLSSGLSFKKKNIPSLVEKWKKIKAEQEQDLPDDLYDFFQ